MKKLEFCQHCGGEYTPKRRGTQKFCSNSCRSRNWLLKQNKPRVPKMINDQDKIQVPIASNSPKKETITAAGVGNAVIGYAAVEVTKSLLTSKNNKPATKGDIEELKSLVTGKRFLPVSNAKIDINGKKAYYDVETGNLVYL